jgi:2',3'-cyclic-nucleotide 2'-phosphodiesterase/3'-nucleotidase
VICSIKIGVTGFAPPQIADRDSTSLTNHIGVDDIMKAARRVVPQIQAAGADVVVALCHSGIGEADESPFLERAAVPLASVDGLHALLVGRTHEQFPNAPLQRKSTQMQERLAQNQR